MVRSHHHHQQQYRYPTKLILISILTFTFTLPTSAKYCDNSPQCDDKLPCSIDFCNFKIGKCVNVGLTPTCNATSFLTTSKQLITSTNNPQLSKQDFLNITNTAITLLRDLHPHRSLHLNYLKVDPVAQLNTFRDEISGLNGTLPTNIEFHKRMIFIFKQMDDIHTQYVQPPPLNTSNAFLPFTMNTYYEGGGSTPRYVVTDVALGVKFKKVDFGVGSKIKTWNGEAIHDVVMREGEAGYGSNMNARLANGVSDIRFHRLAIDTLPVGNAVKVGYESMKGEDDIVSVDWIFCTEKNKTKVKEEVEMSVEPSPTGELSPSGELDGLELESTTEPSTEPSTELSTGMDTTEDVTASPEWEINTEEIISNLSDPEESKRLIELAMKTITVDKIFCDFISAAVVPTSNGVIGRISIHSFIVVDEVLEIAATEIIRELLLLPRTGVIIDLRRNIGGLIDNIRWITALLTEKDYKGPLEDFRVTPFTNKILNAEGLSEEVEKRFKKSRPSLRTSLLAGVPLTGAVELFDQSVRFPRFYNGSYVVVADGLTYSAGDMFVALAKDNGLAPVIIEGGNTGAGGSTVNPYSSIAGVLPQLFKPLPGLVDLRLSVSRVLRSGTSRGTILENFGVEADLNYLPTLRDRLENDKDLFERLGAILANQTNS